MTAEPETIRILTPEANVTFRPEGPHLVMTRGDLRCPYGDYPSALHRFVTVSGGKTLKETVVELAQSGHLPSISDSAIDDVPCRLLEWSFPKAEMRMKVWVVPSKGYFVKRVQSFFKEALVDEKSLRVREFTPGLYWFEKAEEKSWRGGELSSHVIAQVKELKTQVPINRRVFTLDSLNAPPGTEIQNRALGMRYRYGGRVDSEGKPAWRYYQPKTGVDFSRFEGKPPPALDKIDGWMQFEERSWRDLRGKVVIVDFWALNCAPCVANLPHLVELYNKHHTKGLRILGVHYAIGGEAMRTFVADRKLPYGFASDPTKLFAKALGVESIPRYFVVDRRGTLRVANANHAALENIVQTLLAEKP